MTKTQRDAKMAADILSLWIADGYTECEMHEIIALEYNLEASISFELRNALMVAVYEHFHQD